MKAKMFSMRLTEPVKKSFVKQFNKQKVTNPELTKSEFLDKLLITFRMFETQGDTNNNDQPTK